MHEGKIILAQLMDFIPKYEFSKCVKKYRGNHRMRSFSCYDQFLCMAFAQLTYRESLRDIEICLHALKSKLYHAGFRGDIARSTLADANETRDWRIYAEFAQVLIATARELYANEDLGVELKQTAYALDSSTIDLCLALFPWAKFRTTKAAVKMHTLLDIRGSIPSVIIITPGKVHDVNILDDLLLEAGAIYIMDRGYLDFERLYHIHVERAFFITRAKCNTQTVRSYSRPVDCTTGVRSDQIIRLRNKLKRKDYPEAFRRIGFYDVQQKKKYVFLTNNLVLPAATIARLYQCRWLVELFFKWIKQHLRIKAFYGTSENAVKTQIWISISVYVLIAIVKKRLELPQSLYTILQLLSVSLFEKTPILQAFFENDDKAQIEEEYKQLEFNIL
jgi:hypothetical protein